MTQTSTGRFVWYDLMTTDPEKAGAFYAELFGYRLTEEEIPPGSGQTYRKLHLGDRPVAGIIASPQAEIPTHWMSYVAVDDVPKTIARIGELGGKTHFGPIEAPGQATFAIVGDDQGCAFSVICPVNPMPHCKSDDRTAGLVCWTELWTDDPDRANAFYGDLFGWTKEGTDMGDMGTYWVQHVDGEQHGGIMKHQQPGAPSYWCPYFTVDAVGEALDRATGMGAAVYVPDTEIPDTGRFAVLADPTGGVFSVFTGQ